MAKHWAFVVYWLDYNKGMGGTFVATGATPINKWKQGLWLHRYCSEDNRNGVLMEFGLHYLKDFD